MCLDTEKDFLDSLQGSQTKNLKCKRSSKHLLTIHCKYKETGFFFQTEMTDESKLLTSALIIASL